MEDLYTHVWVNVLLTYRSLKRRERRRGAFVFLVGEERKDMSGHQCTENPPKLDPNSGSGHVEKLGGLDSYVSGSTHSKRAVVLVSHVFGESFYPLFTGRLLS